MARTLILGLFTLLHVVLLLTNDILRYLIVATGSVWEGPFASLLAGKQKLLSDVENWRQKIEKAKAVAIVGAGSVGLGAPLVF